MKGQLDLLEKIDDEIFIVLMKEIYICYGCQYVYNGCCSYYDTKDDYCVLGNKKIPVQL